MAKRPIQDSEIVTTLLTAFFRSRKHAACGECPYREGHNPPVVGSNPAPATEPLGCEPKIPRTYRCRPTSKNVGLFAFTDAFTSVFRGFRLSNSPPDRDRSWPSSDDLPTVLPDLGPKLSPFSESLGKRGYTKVAIGSGVRNEKQGSLPTHFMASLRNSHHLRLTPVGPCSSAC